MQNHRHLHHRQHYSQPSLFLDQWLLQQSSYSPPPPPPPPPPKQQPPRPSAAARDILQSWADLRQNPKGEKLLSSLHTLLSSSSSLHVADPHAKLLLSLLSSPPLPTALPAILRLLYLWTRKSSRPSPSLLHSAVQTLTSTPIPIPSTNLRLLLLLLGSFSVVPTLPPPSRAACLGAIERLLPELDKSGEIAPEVLAGIGYSLSRCGSAGFVKKVAPFLLGFWVSDGRSRGSVGEGLMVMNLVEWVVGEWIKLRSLQVIEALCEAISSAGDGSAFARFAIVMSAAGVLRAFWRDGAASGLRLSDRVRGMVEGAVFDVANSVVSRVVKDGYELGGDPETRLIARCIALGLARCGLIASNGDVMVSVCLGLLNEVLPLGLFEGELMENSVGVLRVREHLDGILFKEAGAISGVLCNQYAMADEDSRMVVESYMWRYCQDFYSKFRVVSFLLKRRNEAFFQELEKMAESVFLMVVVFVSQVSKQKLDPKTSVVVRSNLSVRILMVFSCIEYLRGVRWPEYSDVVRRAVLTLQENANACNLFLKSMPSYSELINRDGCGFLDGINYAWSEDEVQTARLLFYLRVIPTCMANFPAPIFSNKVAPTMFLYMGHPNEKVSRASHSLFAAFMSSFPKESNWDDLTELKEKLVFYYMERSLEVFPGVTPYEGLASGVVALVRHLPAGSPAIFYCTTCLVEKAVDMFSLAIRQDPDLWKNWEADSDPCKKILQLLLRLVSLVDIQVLPYLLKLLAQFIIKLPKDGQGIVLNEMYAMVAESDDVIRKPTLVSWLQSLSYLSSQTSSSSENFQASNKTGFGGENKQDASILNLNRTLSRL